MFSTNRNRLRPSPAGVIAVVALVFAMFGGAYAASGGGHSKATASKKKAKRGPTGPKGATGPTGPQGVQGLAGANGKDGAPGALGKDGVSPVGTKFAGNANGCTEGGVKFEGANTTVACNGVKGLTGPQGEPGPLLKVLPAGETMHGNWIVLTNEAGLGVTAITYPFAAIGLEARYVANSGDFEASCPGSPSEPEAKEGFLCVYVDHSLPFPVLTPPQGLGNEFGTRLLFAGEKNTVNFGTWAATAK